VGKTIVLFVLLLINIYFLFKGIYNLFRLLPSVRSMRKVIGIKKIGKKDKDLYDLFTEWAEGLSKNILIKYFYKNTSAREQTELALRRTGSKDTYEMYIAKTIIYPIISLVITFVLGVFIEDITEIAILGYVVKSTGLIISFLLFFSPKTTLNKSLSKKDDRVILEMPRFIRTYRYSPNAKSFSQVVDDYLKTAKEGLLYDLTVLKADIELVGEEKALQNFSNRVSIPEVREFVTVILTSLRGKKEEADMNLYFVENKFQDRIDRMSDEEMKKRPEVLSALNNVLLLSMGVLLIGPMAIHSITGITQIFK